MCRLRNYIPGDEEAVSRLVKQALTEYGLTMNPEQTDADLQDIPGTYLSSGGAFRVLERDGRIAGSFGLYPTTTQSCELRKMYLLPELKGLGLGKKMMKDALYIASQMGFKEMTLETNSCLKEALGLYKKYGFTEFTPTHLSDRCNLAMKRVL
jgi:putative acetyltransferase